MVDDFSVLFLIRECKKWLRDAGALHDDLWRATRGWWNPARWRRPRPSPTFATTTAAIIGWLNQHRPGIDTQALAMLSVAAGEFWAAPHKAREMPGLYETLLARAVELVLSLREAVEAEKPPAEAEKPPAEPEKPKPSGSVPRPSDDAFRAFWVLTTGRTQTEVAAMMGVAQGTVAKWKAAVERWQAAGNVLPPIAAPPRATRPEPMDPRILDMGARRDGRPPRQRHHPDDLE